MTYPNWSRPPASRYLAAMTPASVAALSPQEFSAHARRLLSRALPDPNDLPVVNRLMAEAKGRGMTWVEGLEYVIEQRNAIG